MLLLLVSLYLKLQLFDAFFYFLFLILNDLVFIVSPLDFLLKIINKFPEFLNLLVLLYEGIQLLLFNSLNLQFPCLLLSFLFELYLNFIVL
jgi:hypothetical protein